MMSRFLFGFATYFGGLRTWLRHGSLLRLSIVPFVLDAICLTVGLYYTLTHVGAIVALILHRPEVWYQFILYYSAYAITALSLFFLVIFFVIIFANLIVFPINDRLAETTLRIEGVSLDGPKGAREWVGKSMRNTFAMLEKAAVLLGAGSLLTLGAFLIPGFGLIAAAMGIFLISIDRIDYACDQYQMTFGMRVAFIRENLSEIAGFSVGLGITTALPFINVLLMPGGVVAGASLVAKLKARNGRCNPSGNGIQAKASSFTV